MECCESQWGYIPETIEEHISVIMDRYAEMQDMCRCFAPKIGIFPYEKCLAGILQGNDWNKINDFIYQENCIRCLVDFQCGESLYRAFLDMLDALAVGNMDTFKLLLPHKVERVTHIYPLYPPAMNMLMGLWYKDATILKAAVPKAEKFVNGKRPQWDRAVMSYLLSLYAGNPKEAGNNLETVCKSVMKSDFDSADRTLFVSAHGLYQLAAYIWDKELFEQLSMPEHKVFSKEYAVWRNTEIVQPKLFAVYPEPMINSILVTPNIREKK